MTEEASKAFKRTAKAFRVPVDPNQSFCPIVDASCAPQDPKLPFEFGPSATIQRIDCTGENRPITCFSSPVLPGCFLLPEALSPFGTMAMVNSLASWHFPRPAQQSQPSRRHSPRKPRHYPGKTYPFGVVPVLLLKNRSPLPVSTTSLGQHRLSLRLDHKMLSKTR
eukprot:GABV01003795.1.p1 GENE.GABV01003795.1~~GABV01003795.1.p1  ORF type:complete len:173 (-),score=19.29 GABV01003795.1:7-504(-)